MKNHQVFAQFCLLRICSRILNFVTYSSRSGLSCKSEWTSSWTKYSGHKTLLYPWWIVELSVMCTYLTLTLWRHFFWNEFLWKIIVDSEFVKTCNEFVRKQENCFMQLFFAFFVVQCTYRASHSKEDKVILLWRGYRFWFFLIFLDPIWR